MEQYREKIKTLILHIVPLLETANDDYWLNYFKYVLEKLDNHNDSEEIIKSLRDSFVGGMGSFSDFIIHKNGIPLIEENNHLETLKDQLFDACEEYLKIK